MIVIAKMLRYDLFFVDGEYEPALAARYGDFLDRIIDGAENKVNTTLRARKVNKLPLSWPVTV